MGIFSSTAVRWIAQDITDNYLTLAHLTIESILTNINVAI